MLKITVSSCSLMTVSCIDACTAYSDQQSASLHCYFKIAELCLYLQLQVLSDLTVKYTGTCVYGTVVFIGGCCDAVKL